MLHEIHATSSWNDILDPITTMQLIPFKRLLAALRRPEYVFRPTQVFRRIAYSTRRHDKGLELAILPWGLPIRIMAAEQQGRAISCLGIHELQVCESTCRLLDQGEFALDIGANIGQVASLMAATVGPSGHVIAFEPHPMIFTELESNREEWLKFAGIAKIAVEPLALSNRSGPTTLIEGPGFITNRGVSGLVSSADAAGSREYEVQARRLDELIDKGQVVALMKIDVEGSELQVLQGAGRLLEEGIVRDIIFEEHAIPPTDVTCLLREKGYAVFYLGRHLLGLNLHPIDELRRKPDFRLSREAPNYLATRNPDRALRRLQGRGWRCLRWKPQVDADPSSPGKRE
jgi:FkbM family methyltransferase